MSNKTVNIRRTKKNPTALPDDLYASRKQILGGMTGLRPLTSEEEKSIMPNIIDLFPEDRDFQKTVNDYWKSFGVIIPFGGLKLEVGVDENGVPLNPFDYVTYKVALQEKSQVALSEEEANNSMTARFYLVDEEEVKAKRAEQMNVEQDALVAFSEIKGDEHTLNFVLRLLGSLSPERLDLIDKAIAVNDIVKTTPSKFLEAVKDRNLEMKAFVHELVEKNIFRKAGNAYLYLDEKYGDNIEEVVHVLNNKKNSDKLLALKAKAAAIDEEELESKSK